MGVPANYYLNESSDLTITAYASGGQANAVQLTARYNVVSVCATPGDSVKLPATPYVGQIVEVLNSGASELGIFPGSGDNLGNGADTVYRLHTFSTQRFLATSTSAWVRLNRSTRYVSAGTKSSSDVDETTMTVQDGTWTDLDLSSYIPVSALGMPLHIEMSASGATSRSCGVRTNGYAGAINLLNLRFIGGEGTCAVEGIVACDAAGVVEYKIGNADTVAADLVVRGWFVEG